VLNFSVSHLERSEWHVMCNELNPVIRVISLPALTMPGLVLAWSLRRLSTPRFLFAILYANDGQRPHDWNTVGTLA